MRRSPESINHPDDLDVPALAIDAVQGFRLGDRGGQEDTGESGVGSLAGVQETGASASIHAIGESLVISQYVPTTTAMCK